MTEESKVQTVELPKENRGMRVDLSDGSTIFVKFRIKHKKRGNHTTECQITDEMGPYPVCIARCNYRDRYDKARGKQIALGRALSKCIPGNGLNRRLRLEVWKKFFKIHTPNRKEV